MCLCTPTYLIALPFSTIADHYGPAEILFVRRLLTRVGWELLTRLPSQGQFRQRWSHPEDIFGATKWCVFRKIEPSRALVETAVNERLERMGAQRLDMLQVNIHSRNDHFFVLTDCSNPVVPLARLR